MGEKSAIQWTDASWPVVQGCDYDSPGCTHCYVVPLLWRMAHNPLPKVSAPLQGLVAKDARGKLHFTGRVELRNDRLQDPLGWKKPRMIFVPSHGDIFHKNVPDAFLHRIFATMACTSRHTYQVLTKRSDRARDYLTALSKSIAPLEAAARDIGYTFNFEGTPLLQWPLPNVWIGASTEDQKRFDERWPALRDTPAAKRFISYEPALGPLDPTDLCNGWYFEDALRGVRWHDAPEDGPHGATMKVPALDWVIVGGESGGKPRPFDIQWAHSIVKQCRAAGVPVFVKQLGAHPFNSKHTEPGNPVGLTLADRKGGDMDEWPQDLRVREFPPGFSRAIPNQPAPETP